MAVVRPVSGHGSISGEVYLTPDAMYRSHHLGVDPLTDIPHFAEAVDRLLHAAAPKRSDAVQAAIWAERYGEAQEGVAL